MLRFKAVEETLSREPVVVNEPNCRPSEYFGEYVFNREKMFKYLPKKTYDAIVDAIDNQKPLSREVADGVAAGMKQWAIDMGVTHYSHWFQPLTDGTAEKHDGFIEYNGKGGVVEEFSGKLLIQQEPDASSFPSGGIRSTFEARGYSGWDISSPAFILNKTLCIPTVFISYTGESLDYKTPLLKALNSVNKAATAVCQYFDENVKRVIPYLGWEQEYFLVDEALYNCRADLMLTGRTLMGHESAKNQQLEDHYFGSIPLRVEAFMRDFEIECHKLGIPCKTRHNEVAPNQYEVAPIYEEVNLANDHNLQLMTVMNNVARRHKFRVLLHEKPFNGVNGSGKHNNWSLGTDTGVQLFAPGKTPNANLQFVTFVANVMAAVHKYNGLLKASIISATNQHRLGANEAPPAIISIFLGKQVGELVDKIIQSPSADALNIASKSGLDLHMFQVPELLIDNTDRNRTSPFAFTGNRFEFRALGSSANCASAMIVINAAVACQLMEFKENVDARIGNGENKEEAIFAEVQKLLIKSQPIRFDGNGYSDEWKEEAARRGLDCEVSAPRMYDNYISQQTIEMFKKTGVMTEAELKARNEVKWELYTKKIQIEARVLGDLVINHIIPAATRYQSILIDNVFKIKNLFPAEKVDAIAAKDMEDIEIMAQHMHAIKELANNMVEARKIANRIEDEREKAVSYHDNVMPYMEQIRYHVDKLELMIDNESWPLPKYRELMFIK